MGVVPYQPQWIDGRESGPSLRDCATRYRAIADSLGGCRGLRVLDFGAWGNYFGARLSHDFGHHTVAVDDSPELSPAPGVEVVAARLQPEEVHGLGRFDITLCLSVLHHHQRWREYLDELTAVTDGVLFVEVAHPGEALPGVHTQRQPIHDRLLEMGGEVICQTPGWDTQFLRPTYRVDVQSL